MRAIGKQPQRGEEPVDLQARAGMTEHRKPERRLGDEDVAGERLEGGAGRIRLALVIARGDDDLRPVRHPDLGRAQNMAGRMEADFDRAEQQRLAIGDGLLRAGEFSAEAERHDGQRLARRQHGAMAGAGMIRVPVGDQRAGDRT